MKRFDIDVDGVKMGVTLNTEGDVIVRKKEIQEGHFKVVNFDVVSKRGNFILKEFKVNTRFPILDVHGISIPGELNNPFFFILPWRFEVTASFNRSFPFLSLINREGTNRFAIGLGDSKIGFKMVGKFIEKTEEFEINISSINRFEGKSFSNSIFVTTTSISWFELTDEYSNHIYNPREPLPDFMYSPVYCTWYAFYQNLDQKCLERVAKKASEMGFEIFILDDGWFTLDTNRGYWYTGDWEVCRDKFPDFKYHVKKVKNYGLKYVLWIAPFMLGTKSKEFDFYKKYCVSSREELGYKNLCPQSMPIKERIIEKMKRLLLDYDLDGFKIDFLDDIPPEVCQNKEHNHFTENPAEGIEEVLSSIKSLGKSVKKYLILEFRQMYASPQMKRFATAFRAADTPFDFDQNRRRILVLRSFSGKLPVYSDPIVWRKGEKPYNISRHFISAIFGVPMVSVDLLNLSEVEERVMRFWLRFYRENRDVLNFGKLYPDFSSGECTSAYAVKDEKAVVALYSVPYFDLDRIDTKEIYILNGSNRDDVTLKGEKFLGASVEVLDPIDGIRKLSKSFKGCEIINVGKGNVIHITK